jgi:hypothetical protein
MPSPGKSSVLVQPFEVQQVTRGASSPGGALKDGEKVAFRVLETLSRDRYEILVRQQCVSAQSRIPLEVGGRYLAEISIRQGVVHFLSSPVPLHAIESLLAQRQSLLIPLSSLFRNLLESPFLPHTFLADCRTAEEVRAALLNCGLLYEARVREALRTGETFSFVEDLKGFLLAQESKHPMASVREAIATALKQIEVHQLLCFQAGPEGPLPFWLPFPGRTIIEGFVKRFRKPQGNEFLLVLRVPLVPGEDVLVTLAWRSGRAEVHFTAGPSTFAALRKGARRLEGQLAALGIPRVTVRVSRQFPKKFRRNLGGIRFVESYG